MTNNNDCEIYTRMILFSAVLQLYRNAWFYQLGSYIILVCKFPDGKGEKIKKTPSIAWLILNFHRKECFTRADNNKLSTSLCVKSLGRFSTLLKSSSTSSFSFSHVWTSSTQRITDILVI